MFMNYDMGYQAIEYGEQITILSEWSGTLRIPVKMGHLSEQSVPPVKRAGGSGAGMILV